jgi:tetratricopeptide (TPR) repeat protein
LAKSNQESLDQAKTLMLNGRFTEALNLLQAEKAKNSLDQEMHFNFDLQINILYIRQGDYKKAREEIDKILPKFDKSLNAIDLLLCKIEATYRLGKSSDALTLVETTEKMLHDLQVEKSETVVRIAGLLYRSAVIHRSTGDLDQAIYFAAQSLILQETYDLRQDSAYTHNILGIIYFQKGNYSKALNHYLKSLDINKSLGDRQYIAKNLNNIGEIYRFKGELNNSLQYYESSFEQFRILGNLQDLAHSYHNKGLIFQGKGNYQLAKENLEKALIMINESVSNDIDRSETTYHLLLVLLDLNLLDEAQSHLEVLVQLVKANAENRTITQRAAVAEALILKKRKSPIDLARSKEILTEIVEEETSYHELTITALIHLCDILSHEISKNEDYETLSRIDRYISRLQNIAVEYHSHLLLVEIYILQSRFAIISGKLQRSLSFLEKANSIAKLNNLDSLVHKLEEEIFNFEEEKERWVALIQRNAPLDERIEYARITEYVRGAKKIIALFD